MTEQVHFEDVDEGQKIPSLQSGSEKHSARPPRTVDATSSVPRHAMIE